MRPSSFTGPLALCFAVTISACAAVQAERQAQEQKRQAFVHRVDFAHIWVTAGEPPPGKPFSVLGEIKYAEPFSPDAIDAAQQRNKLKKIAYEKWPDRIDALIGEKCEMSPDGALVTVRANAIHYESSADREALHHMNDGLVVSPSGH